MIQLWKVKKKQLKIIENIIEEIKVNKKEVIVGDWDL